MLVLISEVKQRRARWVVGWVTIQWKPSRVGQPNQSSLRGRQIGTGCSFGCVRLGNNNKPRMWVGLRRKPGALELVLSIHVTDVILYYCTVLLSLYIINPADLWLYKWGSALLVVYARALFHCQQCFVLLHVCRVVSCYLWFLLVPQLHQCSLMVLGKPPN